ncbi:MAG: DUF2066 domain-containing protein [Granulosicoccus sp.]
MKSAIFFSHLVARLCRTLALVAALILSFATFSAHAQTDAYSIEVAVSERSVEEQQDAYMTGLRRVLLNNSGDKTVLNRDLIRQGLKDAEDYVKAFSYRRPPPGTVIANDTPITRKVQQTGQATQLMLVSFDRELVNQLISDSAPANAARQADAESEPVANTTSALVYILIADQGRDILISDPMAANVQKRAREISGAAGISLVYPTGDDEDMDMVSVEDISTQIFDADKLAAVAGRYAQDTILIGYLNRQGVRGWLGQWTRISGEQQQQAQFETSSLDEGLQEGLGVLNSVAEIDETYRYGGNALSDTEGLVWVGSLDSLDDYAGMMRFFNGIAAVSTVYPKEVNSTSMVFSVIPRSALVDIESALFDTPWLQRSAPPLTTDPNSLLQSADLVIEYTR